MKSANHFLLFIFGSSPINDRAETHFRALAQRAFADDYELEIIDILHHPDQAEKYRILAAPTLVRLSPDPPVKIVGDLSSAIRLRQILGLPVGHDLEHAR
ncbi:MAG: circadian clock protein KaiB [Magnetococcales bacterium]|nr:circadian clock protein KaiB [Magnetococcales bacterium]